MCPSGLREVLNWAEALHLQARTTRLAVRMEPEVMQPGASRGTPGTTASEVGLELKPRERAEVGREPSVWLGRLEPNHTLSSTIASAQFASFPCFCTTPGCGCASGIPLYLSHALKNFFIIFLKVLLPDFFLSVLGMQFSSICA